MVIWKLPFSSLLNEFGNPVNIHPSQQSTMQIQQSQMSQMNQMSGLDQVNPNPQIMPMTQENPNYVATSGGLAATDNGQFSQRLQQLMVSFWTAFPNLNIFFRDLPPTTVRTLNPWTTTCLCTTSQTVRTLSPVKAAFSSKSQCYPFHNAQLFSRRVLDHYGAESYSWIILVNPNVCTNPFYPPTNSLRNQVVFPHVSGIYFLASNLLSVISYKPYVLWIQWIQILSLHLRT